MKIYSKRGFDFEAFGHPYKLLVVSNTIQFMLFEDGTVTTSPNPIRETDCERYVAEGHWDVTEPTDWKTHFAKLRDLSSKR